MLWIQYRILVEEDPVLASILEGTPPSRLPSLAPILPNPSRQPSKAPDFSTPSRSPSKFPTPDLSNPDLTFWDYAGFQSVPANELIPYESDLKQALKNVLGSKVMMF